jgi:cytochrome b subunit of formate dehydrogenase
VGAAVGSTARASVEQAAYLPDHVLTYALLAREGAVAADVTTWVQRWWSHELDASWYQGLDVKTETSAVPRAPTATRYSPGTLR